MNARLLAALRRHCDWKINDTAFAVHIDGDHDNACTARAGKAFAVFLYNVGGRSLPVTQAAFDRHPQWRSE